MVDNVSVAALPLEEYEHPKSSLSDGPGTDRPILSEPVTEHKAEKIEYALGENAPSSDVLRNAIRIREESPIRQQEVLRRRAAFDAAKMELLGNMSRVNEQPLDPDMVSAILAADVQDFNNPQTIFEEVYARKVANETNTFDEGELVDSVEGAVAGGLIDASEDMIAFNEHVKSSIEDLEASIERGDEGGISDTVEQWVPFMSWYNQQNAVEGAPTSSLLLGNNILEQVEYVLSLPRQERFAAFTQAFEAIRAENVYDARDFAHAFISYSNSDRALNNIISGIDLAFPPGAGLLANSARNLLKSRTQAVIQATGTRSTKLSNLQHAAGNHRGAALNDFKQMIYDGARRVGRVRSIQEIVDELPYLFNSAKVITGAGNVLSREILQRLQTTMNENAGRFTQSFVADPVNITRLEGRAQQEAIFRTMEDMNVQYQELSDAIVDFRPINKAEHKINAEFVSMRVGRKNAEGFEDIQSALFAADKDYLLPKGSYRITTENGKHYIEIQKPVDETRASVHDVLRQTTQGESPASFANTFLSFLRPASSQIAKDVSDAKHIATLGSSAMLQTMREIAEPLRLGKKSYRKFNDYLNRQRIHKNMFTGQRGKFDETVGEFAANWQRQFGELPDEQEITAYFTFTQMSDMDYAIRNNLVLTGKLRSGIENFELDFHNLFGQKSNEFEGKFRQNIDWDDANDAGILIWDGGQQLTYVRKRSLGPGSAGREAINDNILNNGYKVIEIGSPGETALRQTPGISQHLPNGRIRYIVTTGASTKPLKYKQIPYRPGGHLDVPDGTFISQPIMETVGRRGTQGYANIYQGDNNLYHVRSRTEGESFLRDMEQARQMRRDMLQLRGKERAEAAKALKAFVSSNLPHTYKQFVRLFQPEHGGIFNIDTPFYLRRKGETTKDSAKLEDVFEAFEDGTVADRSIYGDLNLKFTQERGDPITSLERVGDDKNPIYKFNTTPLLDSVPSMDRALAAVTRNRQLEDVKHITAQRFVNEFADLLDMPLEEMRRRPMDALLNARIKEEGISKERIAAAKNLRRTTLEFLNIKSPIQQSIDVYKQKVADYVFRKSGGFRLDETRIWNPNTPLSSKLRELSFHRAMGFFNPIQLWQQAHGVANLAAREGPINTMKAAPMYTYMRALRVAGDQPQMIAHFDQQARKAFGWKDGEFTEMYDGARRSGWLNVGNEVAIRDDFYDEPIVRSAFGKFKDAGTVFFNEGERFVRGVAWSLAYRKWREANPLAVMNDRAISDIMARAQETTLYMTRENNASWQRGWLSVPTQFFSYQARLIDQFMGKNVDNAERAKIFLTYSAMYGVPVGGAGAAFGVWPWHETLRNQLNERGIVYDENVFSQTMMEGIPSVVFQAAIGKEVNWSERYGPGGLHFLKDFFLDENVSAVEALVGAPGNSLWDVVKSVSPLTAAVFDPNKEVTLEDWKDTLGIVNSTNQLRKWWDASSFGRYETKSGGLLIDGLDTTDATLLGLFDVVPSDLSKAFSKSEVLRELSAHKREMSKNYTRYIRLALDTIKSGGSKEEADKYFARARIFMDRGSFTPQERARLAQDALRPEKDFLGVIEQRYIESTPERQRNSIGLE